MNGLEIYWLRHGIAEDKRPGKTDADRHLTAEGAQEIAQVAGHLRRLGVEPDHILHSPLLRAAETAAIAADVLGKKSKTAVCEGLLPEDNWQVLFPAMKAFLPAQSVMLVGHQPSFGLMIGHLLKPDSGLEIPLKKAGCCRTDVATLVPRPFGELKWLLNPKLLRKIGRP